MDEVKLHGVHLSPFVCIVKIALNLKGIKYEFVEEDLSNKSADLIKYNPVYKRVPVLVHNGKPISESLVILEYINDAWKEVPFLPQDVYQKSQARFWTKFIEEKCTPAIFKSISSHGEERAVAELSEQLHFLENELKAKKYFGGDNINLVDISAILLAYWVGAAEEALGIELMNKDKFPKLIEWSKNLTSCQVVKDGLPTKDKVLAFFKKEFGKA